MLQQLQRNSRQNLRQKLLLAAGKLLRWPVTVLEKLSVKLRKKKWEQKAQLPHLAVLAAWFAFPPLPAAEFESVSRPYL